MVMSIVRQLVVLLPAAYFFSLTGKVNLVWLAFPIAEVVAIILCAFFMIYINKTVISKIGTTA
jgi:Na+-driven multidrug efflux pump